MNIDRIEYTGRGNSAIITRVSGTVWHCYLCREGEAVSLTSHKSRRSAMAKGRKFWREICKEVPAP